MIMGTIWLFLRKFGVHFVGALVIRALLFGDLNGARDFWKLPYAESECVLT